MLLMNGRHPYDHIGGTSVVENIKKCHFTYGQRIRPESQSSIPVDPRYIQWSHLTINLKISFIQIFTEDIKSSEQAYRSETMERVT